MKRGRGEKEDGAAATTLAELLEHTTVAELKKADSAKPLVTLKATDTVEKALSMLAEHDILSAPVIERVGSTDATSMFLGFVDVLDLTGYVLNHADHGEFFSAPLKECINYSHTDPALRLAGSEPASEMVKLMRRKRIHRVAVGDAGELSHVVTQSDVVALFARNLHLIQKKTLAELKLVRAVVSVMVDTTAAEAFRTLYDHRVSGIALLDEAGRVSANVSASDLRALTRKNFHDFDRSALAFLSRAGQLAPLRSVSESTTLPDAIAMMAEERLHRLYITAADTGAIRGVVTLSDVIQLLTGHRHHSHHSAK